MATSERQLSSRWTFCYKFVFPTLWVGGFACATLLMFARPDNLVGSGDARWVFLFVTLVGSGVIYWACGRLKRVILADSTLAISNYRETIEVPLRDVESVSASLLISPELIWLRFRRPTAFGQKLVFMPSVRFSFGFSRHPLAAELRHLLSDPATQA